MKKYLLVILAAAFVFAGCNKKQVNVKAEFEDLMTQLEADYYATNDNPEAQKQLLETAFNEVYELLEDNMGASYTDTIFMFMYAQFSAEQKAVLFDKMPQEFLEEESISKMHEMFLIEQEITVGHMYKDFTALTPEGEEISLGQFIGQTDYVLVDFWASWCNPCRRLIPVLKNIYAVQPQGHFQILSCSVDQDEEAWRKAIAEEEMPWPQAHEDAEHNGSDLYGVQYIPFTVLFDKEGTIVAVNPDEAKLEEILLGE